MTEEKSIFQKFIKGSLLDKIIIIVWVFTFLTIILGTSYLHVDPTLYLISLITFIILTFFIMPLKSFMLKSEDGLFGLEELLIFVFHGINTIVFCITLYIVFLSDNCQLNISYWLFILSALLLIVFFVFTKFKKKKSNEDYIKESRGKKITNWVFTSISLLLLLKSAIIPIIYTVTIEDYLEEVEKPKEIYVYTIDKESNKKKYDSKVEIKDSELISEIINQINSNKTKGIKGVEALNYMKSIIKLPHYELSHFRNDEFDGFLYLKIFEDGSIVMRKLWFGSLWIGHYETYYKLELLPETFERIINIIDKNVKPL